MLSFRFGEWGLTPSGRLGNLSLLLRYDSLISVLFCFSLFHIVCCEFSIKMPKHCAAVGCKTGYDSVKNDIQYSSVSVHRFPLDESCRQLWVTALRRKDYSPTKESVVCSRHFLNTDFSYESSDVRKRTITIKKRRLKKNAVPSIFPESLNSRETKKIKVNGIKESFSPRNGVEIVENGISESSPVESPVKVEVSVENKLEISGKVPAVEEEKPSLPNEHQLFLEETKLLLLKKIRQSQTRTNVPPTPAAHQINKAAQQPHQQFNQNVNNQQKTVSSNLQHKHQVNRPIMQKSIPPNAIPSGLIRGPPPSKVLPSVNKPLPSKAVNNVHDHQAAAKREQAAKLALKKELEKTLLQIPPPKPPPANLDFIPWPSIDFLYLIGLEESVHRLIFSNTESTENEMPAPFLCRQCNTDFTTLWKREEFNGRPSIICEQCMISNNKKAVKKEHTNRLKNAVEKALQQEQEIVKKIKEEENQRKSISPQTHLNSNQKSSHVSASSRGRILNPAPASAAPRTLAPVSATSLRPQLY